MIDRSTKAAKRSLSEIEEAARAPALTASSALGSMQQIPLSHVFARLGTTASGLDASEALSRLDELGPNTIRQVKGKSLASRFLANFIHVMALLLWAGGAIGFLAGQPQLGIAIWMVNVINGCFSFWQEYRAEKATEALRRMLPAHALVYREGEEQRVPAEELVPGDVVLLREGDHVSADARVVEEAELLVDQSTFTGESHPARKTADPTPGNGLDFYHGSNIVFAGTSVVAGTARAVVFATGMSTQLGRIAHLTQTVGEEPSSLQREMAHVTRAVTLLAMSIGLAFFLAALLIASVDLATSFVFAMGMIVAFVPEGMLPTVTLSLAMGVQRMARRHALVKKLSAVETLGCTTVICTDKTGTLTQNAMTVRHLWLPGHELSIEGVGYAPTGRILENGGPVSTPVDGDVRELLVAAALCNDSHLTPPETAERSDCAWSILGDPTEAALLVAAAKAGVDLEAEEQRAPRVHELPFDSRRKRMSTFHELRPTDGSTDPAVTCRIYVKGSPAEILALSVTMLNGGVETDLDEATRHAAMAANDQHAASGLRVLAVASRSGASPTVDAQSMGSASPEAVERDLTFLGLIAMRDPPRPEVKDAVDKCHRAGIRIVMTTGDYGLTAESIAREAGIVGPGSVRIVSGRELDDMNEQALRQVLQQDVIFARVNPEHKLRVVATLQTMGHIVAVTGDGANDAPALKKADIGVAMGITGTDVAIESADMVLADDNFASIVDAIEEGRAVYANIRRFAVYVFNSNMAEAVPFILMLFSRGAIPLPLTVMQVLAIDLGTDMVPAIGLGGEVPEPDVMEHPPRKRNERLLTPRLLARALLWYGAIESFASISAYVFLNALHGWPAVPLAPVGTSVYQMATTITLAGIVAGQIGAVFGCRTNKLSVFKVGLFSNRLVLVGVVVELVLLASIIYVPVLQPSFNTTPIGPIELAYVFCWTPVILLADEARKLWLRHRVGESASTEATSHI